MGAKANALTPALPVGKTSGLKIRGFYIIKIPHGEYPHPRVNKR